MEKGSLKENENYRKMQKYSHFRKIMLYVLIIFGDLVGEMESFQKKVTLKLRTIVSDFEQAKNYPFLSQINQKRSNFVQLPNCPSIDKNSIMKPTSE
jgi:hypothetical protein